MQVMRRCIGKEIRRCLERYRPAFLSFRHRFTRTGPQHASDADEWERIGERSVVRKRVVVAPCISQGKIVMTTDIGSGGALLEFLG